MRVEREIAAFAFPFAAGVIAAFILGASPCIINPTYPTLAMAATFLSAAALAHPSRRSWTPALQWTAVALCALACGAFIGLSGLELHISEMKTEGAIGRMAQRIGIGMQSVIDGMPFENGSTGGIIKALLTGNRSGLTPEVTQAFRDSGASHILALSGLHLGIIYALTSRIMSIAGNSPGIRRARSVAIMLLCGMYTLATGAGASITRAYIFIMLKETADMTGRHASLKSILAASLVIHLAFAPSSASDVGFQLSYAAMFGIAYIFPHLQKLWRNDWYGLKWIWSSVSLSIACQLTTGPLAYYYFGTFPQHFLLTNLLAIPLAGIMIPTALLAVMLTAMGCCPDILLQITEWMTQTMTESLSIIASM